MLEGRRAQQNDLAELQIAEDDPGAMTVICWIAHKTDARVPNELDINELLVLSRLCRKYECITLLRGCGSIWITAVLQSTVVEHVSGRARLLAVAYSLENADLFSTFGSQIITEHCDTPRSTLDQALAADIGPEFDKVFGKELVVGIIIYAPADRCRCSSN